MSALTLAETLFADLIDGRPSVNDETAEILAQTAVRYAEIFRTVDSKAGLEILGKVGGPKMKGCRACYGSGGKQGNPCRFCNGTGKVPA